MTTATVFNNTLLLGPEAKSAFASLGYDLCTGTLDLTGKLPQNYIDDLKQAYIDAFWNGRWK